MHTTTALNVVASEFLTKAMQSGSMQASFVAQAYNVYVYLHMTLTFDLKER